MVIVLVGPHSEHLAARLGIGALTCACIDPSDARHWVADSDETFTRAGVPIGHAVNPTSAMVTGCACHADAAEAARRGHDGFRCFPFALAHHDVFGTHTPGRTHLWKRDVAVRDQLGPAGLGDGAGCIGTPAQLHASLRRVQDAGVDQTIFIQQGGKSRHADICAALERCAAEVMPECHEQDAAREARKRADLGPAIEAAFARKRAMPGPAGAEIPT
jgi:alkanesulfonate monooxygenase SsuD/methylene tetrahydromethanopterin reductase-like flavin-dependent oxidoreductase (luciferase family)